MSVDQLPPGKAPAAKHGGKGKYVRYDEYIDKQIQATRRLVKTVDVMTAIVVMTIGTLAFLLVAAIVEHWLVPDGFNLGVRLVLFVLLMLSLTFYTTRRLWPLFAGSINPAYAAQAIEHDNPSLKNSLLNLLLFRERRDDITDAVYETLEEQAAKGLTRVPVESAVDRTHLLRLGYVLVGIVAAVALYKIFSPKDPFVSAERVLMPWARIASASRVSIDNVTPGAVTLARGEVLTVSADVRGISEDDAVVVRYTTADGQALDRPAPMKPSAAGLRFTGQIPPAEDGTKAGVAQNLRYRIEAGDARSLEYAVTVVAAPTITIERIDYDYPDYTDFTDRSVDRLGDVRAIEGTRVTIHAHANEPIEDAAIDFEADGRRDVRLNANGSDAQASFTLELRDDRQTPKFTSYVLRFTGAAGRPNRDPVKYPIDVLPDYPPEVAIHAPAEKIRDVRLDETVAIEVESRDPDFALADVQVHGEAAGIEVFDQQLLKGEHTGRFTGRYLFTPIEHKLKAGDVVRYWVVVHDNRTPKPNETITDSQTLRIVDPGQPPQDRLAQREKRDPQDSQEGQQGESASADGQSGESGGQSSGDQQGESGEQGESASADGKPNQSGNQNSGEQSGDSQSGESNSGDGSDGQSGGEGQSSATEQSGDKQGESASADGKSNQPGESTQTGNDGQQSNQHPSDQPSGGESSEGESASADGRPNQSGDGAGGGTNDQQRENSNSGARPQSGEPQPDSESSPVSSEGDNDGEAFERIQDFLKQQGKLPKESQSEESQSNKPDESTDSASGESASADGEQSTDSTEANQSNNSSPATKPDEPADSKSKPSTDSQNEQSGTDPGAKSDSDNAKENEAQESQSPDGQHTNSEGESASSGRAARARPRRPRVATQYAARRQVATKTLRR